MDSQLAIWLTLGLVALFTGFSKTGLPSLGILSVTLLVLVFPAKDAVGLLLPMLVVGDIVAVTYYRRAVVWKHLLALVPSVLIGIVAGYLVLDRIESDFLQVMIGVLVLALIVLHFIKDRLNSKLERVISASPFFSWTLGALAGFTTMIGNAAGGIMAIYLFSKRLNKTEFVGTGAWFFLFVNLLKIPFYMHLGMINQESLVMNAWTIPVILIGCAIGIFILKKISEIWFQRIIFLLTVIGAIKLIF